MQSSEIRQRFLTFFEKRGHKIIPSASLVPENDPSVLFNTAGMQPLVPYLMGQKHPMGTRIADVQKCVRTGDLDDIGDNRHFSFFEMMGNWSLGDYFKEDAIKWSYEFLTSKEEGLGLDVNRLYVTIFEGDENAPLDTEAKEIWMSVGIPEHRIYALPADDNWWSPGDNGPCGPCSEMFYDMLGTTGDLSKEAFIEACKKEDVIEIWNDVFMEYEKKDGKVIGKLAQKNVDTGAGLERITAVMQGKKTAYDTDIFEGILEDKTNDRARRIVLDHLRTSLFLISDGVVPANKERGYILRRLIRRAVTKFNTLNIDLEKVKEISNKIINKYSDSYPEISKESNISTLIEEINKFSKTIENGLRIFNNRFYIKDLTKDENEYVENELTGKDLFDLWTTHGFPVELSIELAEEKSIHFRKEYALEQYSRLMDAHQKLSQTASAGMFKGGLANTNEKTVRLHTAHHLLLAGLQQIVSPSIKQRGSNITEERLRMDFSFDRKLTDEEKQKVEEFVNEKIAQKLNVVRREMPFVEAEKLGAEMEFGAKYPEIVSVYFIEDENGNPVSKEFCGGPHVSNTSEIGHFKIQKEEASSAGIRRIKAVLE